MTVRCSSACDTSKDGPMYAVQFQSPTATSSTKGQPVETFSAQFTRHCNVLPLVRDSFDDEMVGPNPKGIVRYQLKCWRDPETVTITNKWKAYIPQLGITLNLKSQPAYEGRRAIMVGVHVV